MEAPIVYRFQVQGSELGVKVLGLAIGFRVQGRGLCVQDLGIGFSAGFAW